MKCVKVKRKDLIFDNKAVEQCKSCKRYGKKATCPPYAVSIKDLKYKYGLMCYKKFKIDDIKNWKKLSIESSLMLHNLLIDKRNQLFLEGHYFAVAFGAGSCKLCVKCSFPCRFPERSITPVEAIGLNIVKLMKKYCKINLKFPVKKYFYRVGMILYD